MLLSVVCVAVMIIRALHVPFKGLVVPPKEHKEVTEAVIDEYALTGTKIGVHPEGVAEYINAKGVVVACPIQSVVKQDIVPVTRTQKNTKMATNTTNQDSMPAITPETMETEINPSKMDSKVNHGISKCTKYWHSQLVHHPDKVFVERILSFIDNGAEIGSDPGKIEYHIQKNWPSAIANSKGVAQYIAKHKATGAIQGPFLKQEKFVGSPLGAFTKSNSKKLRVIHDLSWPPGHSVNSSIDKAQYAVMYNSVTTAVELSQKYNEVWYAKTDLSDAYLSCPVRQQDRNLLGFTWDDECGNSQQYRFASLPLGLRSSAKLFNDYAEALKFIYINNGASKDSIFYLDDILTLGHTKQNCQKSLDVIIECAKNCGFGIRHEKTVGPVRSIEFLGITIDSVRKELRVSDERVSEMLDTLQNWLKKKWCTKRQLLSLVGKMTFYFR